MPATDLVEADHSAAVGEFALPLTDPSRLRAHFADQGYVVVRGAVPRSLCAAATTAFASEVRPSRAYFRRHASSDFEQHVFTEAGFMKYPIMNIQDLPEHGYGTFRALGLAMLAHDSVRDVMALLLGEPGRIVHTMYFDGNQKTWAHRDSHYIDAQETGRMIGAWVAAEDIHPGAGPFYVYAGSHRTPTPPDLELDRIDPNGPEYKRRMAAFAGGSALRLVAPELKQGDMILWSSLTIHGSLATTQPHRSRRSFTAHYIPASQTYLWGRKAEGSRRELTINRVPVTLHGDRPRGSLHAGLRKAERLLEVGAPALYRAVKTAKSGMVGSRPRP